MREPSFVKGMGGSSRLLPISVAQTSFTAASKGKKDWKARQRAILSKRSGGPIVFSKKMDNPDAMIGAGPYRLESSEKGVSLAFKARSPWPSSS